MRPFVPRGYTREFLLVGEAPGEHEDEISRRPFTGKAGILLRQLLVAAGYAHHAVALVNALRGRPPHNRTPTMVEIRACRPFLLTAIERLQPRVVIGLGETAARALLNRGDVAIKALRGFDPAIPYRFTYHPASCFYAEGLMLRAVIQHDLAAYRMGPSEDGPFKQGELGRADLCGLDTEYSKTHLLTLALAGSEGVISWPKANP